jgi:hypothetical protein
MRRHINKLAMVILFASSTAFPASVDSTAGADSSNSLQWNFEVFLDDSRIGFHNFRLEKAADQQRLVSEAEFKVKFLFMTLYKYQHENSEVWEDDCLQRIESRTNANGKKFSVSGLQGPDAFELEGTDRREELAHCLMTFAYWNPDFLQESELLNPQTGEILPVSVEPLATEAFSVRGESIEAQRYRLQAKGMDLHLWYSMDGAWLGLESTTKDGRTIRYELT